VSLMPISASSSGHHETELKPLVEQAFERGFIGPYVMRLEDFEEDLKEAIEHPHATRLRNGNELTLFGDIIAELSAWSAFNPKPDRRGIGTETMRMRATHSMAPTKRILPTSRIGLRDQLRFGRHPIHSRPSAAMIPVHAGAAASSRNAVSTKQSPDKSRIAQRDKNCDRDLRA